MTCPNAEEWDLLAMEALEDDQAAPLLAHARTCAACRARYGDARRGHIDRVRMYEAFDRDHEERREQLMAALPDEPPQRFGAGRRVLGVHRLGDLIMRFNTPTGRRAAAVLAPAACIVIAVALLMSTTQTSAFASAIQHLKQAGTIICRVTTTTAVHMQPDPQGDLSMLDPSKLARLDEFNKTEMVRTEKLYVSTGHGVRRDAYEEHVLVKTTYVPQDAPTLILDRAAQTYQEVRADEDAWLPDEVREAVADRAKPDIHFMGPPDDPQRLIRGLRNLTADADRELGYETVDGREAIGYEIAGEKVGFGPPWTDHAKENRAEMWVDAETGRAVRLVFRFVKHVPGSRAMPLAARFALTTVYDNFEWDPPLAADWFAPIIPDDYTLHEESAPEQMEMPDEAALVEALKVYSEQAGRYPTSLNTLSLSMEISALLGSIRARQLAAQQTGSEAPNLPDIRSLGKKMQGLALYTILEMTGHRPEYFGDTVNPADTDKVLMQWQLEDGRLRVIYGDLRAETIAE
ncbi:MAG: hypothetical protein JSU86_15290 [Phycisphaerales bacterium]|nr:MAG: hypothetical protein JSU86_15290 [Phycisphaerales bacterium]